MPPQGRSPHLLELRFAAPPPSAPHAQTKNPVVAGCDDGRTGACFVGDDWPALVNDGARHMLTGGVFTDATREDIGSGTLDVSARAGKENAGRCYASEALAPAGHGERAPAAA
jgi:hypothetical protein